MSDRAISILDQSAERLRNSPLRMTRKRQRILESLATFDRLATAQELISAAGLPASDLVTVYRTLDAFASVGVVQIISLENGTKVYELTAPDDHHHHIICRKCHRAERVSACIFHQLETEARQHGYTAITHIMEIYGLCPVCKANDP